MKLLCQGAVRGLSRARLLRVARKVLVRVRGPRFAGRALVSLAFVGPVRMRKLNRRYRGQDRPTDVLSFPQYEGVRMPVPRKGPLVLGDVAICPGVAARQARERGTSTDAEIEVLFVHGLLHLLGYDHAGKAQAKRMFDLQSSLTGIPGPGGRC